MGKRTTVTTTGGPKAFDWSEVHRRLESAQQIIEQGRRFSAEEQQRILHARATELARASGRQMVAPETLEVLEFLLAHEHYGIELSHVREVYPLKDLTPLPGTPPFILGLTNVRGQVLSIIDIKRFFGLPGKGLTDLNKIIIVQSSGMEIGVLADAVLGLKSVPADEIQPSLPTLTGIREEFLRGVTRESLVVLDARRLLSVPYGEWKGTV